MTAFTDKNIIKDGPYLHYRPEGGTYRDEKFIARHKHMRRNQRGFKSFLKKHFTVEEFFARMEAGESPLAILQSKGYIPAHIKRWMREGGFPITAEGHAAWKADYMEKIERSSREREQRERDLKEALANAPHENDLKAEEAEGWTKWV